MRPFFWLLRAALFFLLFAFALNNQQEAQVRWLFGHQWQAPMVIVLLAAFALGCGFALVAAAPWLRRRPLPGRTAGDDAPRPATREARDAAASAPDTGATAPATLPPLQHPPREGL